jgi:hypothetical protein
VELESEGAMNIKSIIVTFNHSEFEILGSFHAFSHIVRSSCFKVRAQ